MSTDSLTSFFPVWKPFIYFSCLIALASTFISMLSGSGESRYPYVIHDHRMKAFSLSSLMMFIVGVLIFFYALYEVEDVSFYS